MHRTPFPIASDSSDIDLRIKAAVLLDDHDARVTDGLAVLDMAMAQLAQAGRAVEVEDGLEFVELEADDLFDLVFIAMGLIDPAARLVALTGLANALQAPNSEALQISCLAVQRFFGGAEPPSTAAH